MALVEAEAHYLQPGVVEAAFVDVVQKAETLTAEALQRLLVEVEDHRLEGKGAVPAGLRGLRVFHQQIPVGHHVAGGYLACGIEHAGRLPGLYGAEQGKHHQRGRQRNEAPFMVMVKEHGADMPEKLGHAHR